MYPSQEDANHARNTLPHPHPAGMRPIESGKVCRRFGHEVTAFFRPARVHRTNVGQKLQFSHRDRFSRFSG